VKKCVFISLILSNILFLNASTDIYAMNNKSPMQKELNDLKSYKQMINDLKNSSTLGDVDSMFYLGFVYLNGAKLKDGTQIKGSIEKAYSILMKATKIGSDKSAALLIKYSLENNDLTLLKEVVKSIQTSKNYTLKDKDYYSQILASFILDSRSNDGDAIEIATKWLYNAEKKRPTYKMQFILASMYQKLGNMTAANYYLNKSCSNPHMKMKCSSYKKSEK